MLDIPMFWLGPIGQMMPLACPEPGVSNGLKLKAASSTSLSARSTVTIQGYRREWGFQEAWLDHEDMAFLEAMFSSVIKPPYRILDPLKKNRFRPSVAACRQTSVWSGGYDSWQIPVNNGIMEVADADFPAVSYVSDGDLREVQYRPSSALVWHATNSGNMFLYPNGLPNTDGTYKFSRTDPVLPGETITVSFAVRLSAAGQGALSLATVSPTGTVGLAGATTFTNTAWGTTSFTYTVPSDGSVVGVFPYFTISSDTIDLFIGPGQMEEGSDVTSWEPGYGAPECYISNLNVQSPRFPLCTVDLTITEL